MQVFCSISVRLHLDPRHDAPAVVKALLDTNCADEEQLAGLTPHTVEVEVLQVVGTRFGIWFGSHGYFSKDALRGAGPACVQFVVGPEDLERLRKFCKAAVEQGDDGYDDEFLHEAEVAANALGVITNLYAESTFMVWLTKE